MAQLVTRIDDELASSIDALIERGRFASRSDVVRAGVVELIDRERRAAVAAEILAGYRSLPETSHELVRAHAAARAMIADEPW